MDLKSKVRPSKSMTDRVEEYMYDYTVRACEENNAFFLIALNQEFNFGAERLTRLIARYNKVSAMYRNYIRDRFSDEEIHSIVKDAIEDIGLDPDTIYTGEGKGYFTKIKAEKRKFEKNNVPTLAEAARAKESLHALKAAIKEQNAGT